MHVCVNHVEKRLAKYEKKNQIDPNKCDICTLNTMVDFHWKLSPNDEGPKFDLSPRGQHLNLLSTWLCIMVLSCQYLQIHYFIFYYVSVFINGSSKQRKLSYLEQLKMLSRNLPFIFYFHLKDKFHGRSKIFSQWGLVMHYTHFFLSRRDSIIHFLHLVIFCRFISWHVSFFSWFSLSLSWFL